jgi:hypothetical protein
MKKIIFLFFALMMAGMNVHAEMWTPLNISIYSPVALVSEANVAGLDIGLLYTNVNECYGIQGSLIYGNAGYMHGLQTALVTGAGTLYGLQCGLVCHAEDVSGLQVYVFYSNTLESFSGIQLGAVFAKAENFYGLQGGFVNQAEDLHGLQIGFINIATRLKGLQIGAINVVKECTLIPFMVGLNVGW